VSRRRWRCDYLPAVVDASSSCFWLSCWSHQRQVWLEPVIGVELERVEALELLGTTLAHLNDAEARAELSPRVPLLMAIRDKLALATREGR
jgi:hypothetical protein